MPAHKHAANMALYAQDAAETGAPWERWEYEELRSPGFHPCRNHPGWLSDFTYRRKPRTIRIGEFDVPEPLREAPVQLTTYYVPNMFNVHLRAVSNKWADDQGDMTALTHGLVHLDAKAAELHAKALISLSAKP